MPMLLTERPSPDFPNTRHFDLGGTLNLADAGTLQQFMKRIGKEGCRYLVLHLDAARDIDRACWDSLVSAARRSHKNGGECVLLGVGETILAQMLPQWLLSFRMPELRPDDLKYLPEHVLNSIPGSAEPHPVDLRDRPSKSVRAHPSRWATG